MEQEFELPLTETPPSIILENRSIVYEDGVYQFEFRANSPTSEITSITANLNGAPIDCELTQKPCDSGYIGILEGRKGNALPFQPFLLQYDLIVLSFLLEFSDGITKEVYSEFLLAVSQEEQDTENISGIVEELLNFDNSQINSWCFGIGQREIKPGLTVGNWQHNAYKSLSSYTHLIEEIVACYQNNYAYFRTLGKHSIQKRSSLQRVEDVKFISTSSFHWLMQNSERFVPIAQRTGIEYQGKNYLPTRVQTEILNKSLDVYENQILMGFLISVLTSAKSVLTEFEKIVRNEEFILRKLQGKIAKTYQAPIITVKSLQVSYSNILIHELNNAISNLQIIWQKYHLLFNIKGMPLKAFPRKTKTFQEIRPYAQVFEMIIRWYKYGEYNLNKEKLILQVKTIDKLFEYYCLYTLLQLFANNGFDAANAASPAKNFDYKLVDGQYQKETDIANTYILCRRKITVTLYFQPVVSAQGFQNGISLYRTTTQRGYYAPDFILKFSAGTENRYVILDSKFSKQHTIKDIYLPEIIKQYSNEIAATEPVETPQMVWALQGRVEDGQKSLWELHVSPLARKYRPQTSFGIIAINTLSHNAPLLWREFERIIETLDT